jgi:tripartite ATP-independent transporter DctM subunit
LLRPAGAELAVGIFSGEFGRDLAKAGAATMRDVLLEQLAGLFGHELKRAAAASVAVNWDAEPWVRGYVAAAQPGAADARQRLAALNNIWGVLGLFVFIIGGIYAGIFTPTEAAGVGAFAGFLFALARKALTWQNLQAVLLDSAKTTATIFVLLIGALVFSNYVDMAGVPRALGDWVGGAGHSPLVVILFIIAVYLVLGCFLDSMSMLFLTVPVFYPIVATLGYDLVWFGILVVTMVEIALITPPVGMNLFVVQGLRKDGGSFRDVIMGSLPYVFIMLGFTALLIVWPQIVTWLPESASAP